MTTKVHPSVEEKCDEVFMLSFVKEKFRNNFEQFQRGATSSTTFFYFLLFATVGTIFARIAGIVYYSHVINAVSLCLFVLFTFAIGWVIYMIQIKCRKYSSWLPLLETIWLFSTCINVNILLLVFIYNGVCEEPGWDMEFLFSQWNCRNAQKELPEYVMTISLMLPTLLSILIKSIKYKHVVSCWIMNIAFVIFIIGFYHLELSIVPFLCIIPMSFLVLYEYQRQNVSIFLLTEKLNKLANENERMSAEIRANEMRHMIGNVAHDLKTPLASFNTGIEMISDVVEELQSPTVEVNKEQVTNKMKLIQANITDIKVVNTFMLMTINRCIDYTKATNNLKLVARLETLNLKETINLPVHCMKNIQSRLKIESLPIPDSICEYIVTDKQWLQENILCLLSNAVKYSSSGVITMSLSLYERVLLEPNDTMSVKTTNSYRFRYSVDDHVIIPSEKVQLYSDTSASNNNVNNSNKTGLSDKENYDTYSVATNNISMNTTDNNNINSSNNYYSNTNNNNEFTQSTFNTNIKKLKTIEEEKSVSRHNNNNNNGNGSPTAATQNMTGTAQNAFMDLKLTNFLHIEVEDTGIGLTEEKMKSLFAPFKQAQRMAGGTGLGLFSLAKRIEALNGYYGVQKRRDGKQGSLFWFEIPYKPDYDYANTLEEMNKKMNMRIFSGSTDYSGGNNSNSGSNHYHSNINNNNNNNSNVSNTNTVNNSMSISMSSIVNSHLMGVSTATNSISISNLNTPRKSTDSPDSNNNNTNTNTNKLSLSPRGIALNNRRRLSQLPLRILLVDDSFTIQKMTSMLLKRQGHIVTIAENGVEALDMVTDYYRKYLTWAETFSSKSNHGNNNSDNINNNNNEFNGGNSNTVQDSKSSDGGDNSDNNSDDDDNGDETSGKDLEATVIRRRSIDNNHNHNNNNNNNNNTNKTNSGSNNNDSKSFLEDMPKIYDVILMDFQMPVMDGLEATRRIREHERLLEEKLIAQGKNIPGLRLHQYIIGVSANSDHETMQDGFTAGIDSFLAKPFALQAFHETYANHFIDN